MIQKAFDSGRLTMSSESRRRKFKIEVEIKEEQEGTGSERRACRAHQAHGVHAAGVRLAADSPFLRRIPRASEGKIFRDFPSTRMNDSTFQEVLYRQLLSLVNTKNVPNPLPPLTDLQNDVRSTVRNNFIRRHTETFCGVVVCWCHLTTQVFAYLSGFERELRQLQDFTSCYSLVRLLCSFMPTGAGSRPDRSLRENLSKRIASLFNM
jgi:hypothetical protein